MGHRLSKIYTRTGDKGETGLGNGERIAKDAIRVRAYGSIDETNSAIGILLTYPNLPGAIQDCLTQIQNHLFELGAELCIPDHHTLTEKQTDFLEKQLDALNKNLPRLKEFILPGGSPAAAHCHLARAICRRAERDLVSLMHEENVNPPALTYLNRLSDLLFVIARVLCQHEQGNEILWQRTPK